MKLQLCMYDGTMTSAESKECLGEVCAPNYKLHCLQSCLYTNERLDDMQYSIPFIKLTTLVTFSMLHQFLSMWFIFTLCMGHYMDSNYDMMTVAFMSSLSL